MKRHVCDSCLLAGFLFFSLLLFFLFFFLSLLSFLFHAFFFFGLSDLGLLDTGGLTLFDAVLEEHQLVLVFLALLKVLGDERLQLDEIFLASLACDVVEVNELTFGKSRRRDPRDGKSWLGGDFLAGLFLFFLHDVILYCWFRFGVWVFFGRSLLFNSLLFFNLFFIDFFFLFFFDFFLLFFLFYFFVASDLFFEFFFIVRHDATSLLRRC